MLKMKTSFLDSSAIISFAYSSHLDIKHRKRAVNLFGIESLLNLGVITTLEVDWQSFKHVRVNLPMVAYVNWTIPYSDYYNIT